MGLIRFQGGGTGDGGQVERMVGDQIFATLEALINWSNANLGQLRNNSDPVTTSNPWNKSIAQVGASPNTSVYQWDGEDLPSSLPTEVPWTLRDRTLSAGQIKTLYESNSNTNAFDDADLATVNSVQNTANDAILMATSTGVAASSMTETDNAVVFSKSAQFPPGSALLGELRLSDNVEVLGINTSIGGMGFIPHSVVTDTGSDGPETYLLSQILNLNLNSTNTTNLPDPFEFTYTTGGQATFSYTRQVSYQPAEAGTLRVEVFLGTDATGTLIYDDTHEYTQADVDSGAFVPFDVGNNYMTPAGQNLFLRYSGIQLKGGVGAPGEVLAGVNAPAFRIGSHPAVRVDLTHDNNVVTQIQAKTGDDRLDYNALRNTPTLSGDATKRYNDIEYRRTNFTLGLLSTDTDAPGDLYRVETAATITAPASTNDNQLGLHWGIQNASPGETVTIQTDTVTGHTIVIEGLSRPYDIPSGTSIDLVMVDRTATSTNYRIMNQSEGIEGLMRIHRIGGNSINIFGISGRPVHYQVDTAGGANFPVNIMGVGLLPRNESCRALIENVDSTYGANITLPAGMLFKGTTTRTIAIEPGGSYWVTITNNNDGNMEVDIDGPVAYEFLLTSHDIVNTGDNKGDWSGVPAWLSGIITSPTILAERDQLVSSQGAGFDLVFQFSADFSYGGTTAGGIFTTVSVTGDFNDGNDAQGGTITRSVEHRGGAQCTISRTWQAALANDDHFSLRLTGFPSVGATGARMLEPVAYCRVIMKR